ncbi:MAG TPA: AMP-binding protein, partial [Gemmatimonadaceae bacterium]
MREDHMTVTASTHPESAAPRPTAPATLTRLFFDAVEYYDRPNALQVKIAGAYHPISHRTLAERVRRVALGLRALDLPAGSTIGILSENRPEWAIADYACLSARYIDVPLYPTLPAEQMAFILRDSGAVALFVSTEEQARKIVSVRANLPDLRYVIAFDTTTPGGADLTLAALEARGASAETPDAAVRHRAAALAIAPDDVATIIYTSGTTGEPKGAMLTHGNIASNISAVMSAIPIDEHDVSLSFLPLSHILERMFDYL